MAGVRRYATSVLPSVQSLGVAAPHRRGQPQRRGEPFLGIGDPVLTWPTGTTGRDQAA